MGGEASFEMKTRKLWICGLVSVLMLGFVGVASAACPTSVRCVMVTQQNNGVVTVVVTSPRGYIESSTAAYVSSVDERQVASSNSMPGSAVAHAQVYYLALTRMGFVSESPQPRIRAINSRAVVCRVRPSAQVCRHRSRNRDSAAR